MRLPLLLLTSLAFSSQAVAQSAAKPCITAQEAEGLALVIMPEALKSAQATCRPHLPGSAALANPGAMIAKYQAEADGAWPAATAAMGKIVDPQARELLQGELGRSMLPAIMGPMIAGEIKAKDCGAINRFVELLQPLPPRNTAGLLVTVLQLAAQDEKKKDKFNICPFAPPAR
jgi:hypothetical protein